MNARTPVPLRPDPLALAARHRKSLARALVASGRAAFQSGTSPRHVLEKTWSFDDDAALILRSASAITDTDSAPALLTEIIEAVILGSVGAGAALLRRSLLLSFDRAASISLPALIADASHAGFVQEGAPIPVHEHGSGTPSKMEPRAIKTIYTLTREMVEGSNAVALVEECAKRSIGLSLDAHLFDNVAGDDIRPEGLRYNVAAETASGASDPHDAMLEDIETLLTAVAPVGGDVVLIADTTRARMMPARSRGGVLPPVLGSSAINTDDLLAVSTDALACAMSPDIELKTSREAVAHFEDNAPLPISVPGTPNTISAPTISLFQIDGIGQRLKLGVTWQKRHEDTCAWMTTTAW